MNEKDDSKIRELLKASPSLKPPESFYRSVLEKIERASERAGEREKRSLAPSLPRSLAPWNWGIPVKVLATACVLFVIVLSTRETKKPEPEVSRAKLNMQNTRAQNLNAPAPQAEVRRHIDRDISPFVGHPSPFEEVDKEDAKALSTAASLPNSASEKPKAVVPLGSSLQEQNGFAKKSAVVRFAASVGAGDLGAKSAVRSAPSAVGLAGGYGAGAGGARQDAAQWQGQMSQIATPQNVVIKTFKDWQAFWPGQIAPDVDFETFMVVGVFAGTKPTAGYAVEILDVKTLSDKILVTYREINPSTGALSAQVLTQPYHLRLVPKTSLPVIFEKQP